LNKKCTKWNFFSIIYSVHSLCWGKVLFNRTLSRFHCIFHKFFSNVQTLSYTCCHRDRIKNSNNWCNSVHLSEKTPNFCCNSIETNRNPQWGIHFSFERFSINLVRKQGRFKLQFGILSMLNKNCWFSENFWAKKKFATKFFGNFHQILKWAKNFEFFSTKGWWIFFFLGLLLLYGPDMKPSRAGAIWGWSRRAEIC